MPVRTRRHVWRIEKFAAIATCLIAWGVIVQIVIAENDIAAIESKMDLQNGLLTRGETGFVGYTHRGSVPSSARGKLANAMMLAQSAQFQPDQSIKARTLASAREDIDFALSLRPAWGEAWMTKSYILAVEKGAQDRQTLAALSRSYERAPFLKHAAEWRTMISFNQWEMLSPATQRQSIEEAVWAGAMDGAMRVRLFQLARNTPAYAPLAARWYRMKRKI